MPSSATVPSVATARSRFAAGLALAAAGSVLFSGKAIVVKLAYRHGVDAETLIALRMLFAAPFFAAAWWWTSRGAARLSGREHLRIVVIGLLGYYAASYLEVRDCRRSPDHDLAYIRVLASPDAADAYTARTTSFPEGAIVLKEEHADPDCTDLVRVSAMLREEGDWRWQQVDADGTVLEIERERCAGCHAACGVPPGGHEGTCAEP